MGTASLPNALFMADAAASKAGPCGSTIHQSTASVAVKVAFTPQGGSLVRKSPICCRHFVGF